MSAQSRGLLAILEVLCLVDVEVYSENGDVIGPTGVLKSSHDSGKAGVSAALNDDAVAVRIGLQEAVDYVNAAGSGAGQGYVALLGKDVYVVLLAGPARGPVLRRIVKSRPSGAPMRQMFLQPALASGLAEPVAGFDLVLPCSAYIILVIVESFPILLADAGPVHGPVDTGALADVRHLHVAAENVVAEHQGVGT